MPDQLDQLLLPETADEVWERFVKIVQRLGFPLLSYNLRRFANMPRLRTPDDVEWRSTFPPELQEDLRMHRRLLRAWPLTSWAQDQAATVPLSWADSPEAKDKLSASSAELMALLQRHRIEAGHVVSLLGLSASVWGTVTLFSAAGSTQAQANASWKTHGSTITTLCRVMHLRLCALPQSPARGSLTQRQREVVEWAAYGKTVADIAEILGLEPTTVEKHLRLARAALGAETTAQAILQAHQRGLIFIRQV